MTAGRATSIASRGFLFFGKNATFLGQSTICSKVPRFRPDKSQLSLLKSNYLLRRHPTSWIPAMSFLRSISLFMNQSIIRPYTRSAKLQNIEYKSRENSFRFFFRSTTRVACRTLFLKHTPISHLSTLIFLKKILQRTRKVLRAVSMIWEIVNQSNAARLVGESSFSGLSAIENPETKSEQKGGDLRLETAFAGVYGMECGPTNPTPRTFFTWVLANVMAKLFRTDYIILSRLIFIFTTFLVF